MLQLRANGECCGRDLPPDVVDAMICSFECTFCRDRAETVSSRHCPDCGGDFVQRLIRPAHLLAKYPPSGDRVLKTGGCLTAS